MSGRAVNVARPLGSLAWRGFWRWVRCATAAAAPAESAPGTGSPWPQPRAPPQDPGCAGFRDGLRPDGPLPAPGRCRPARPWLRSPRSPADRRHGPGQVPRPLPRPQTGQLVARTSTSSTLDREGDPWGPRRGPVRRARHRGPGQGGAERPGRPGGRHLHRQLRPTAQRRVLQRLHDRFATVARTGRRRGARGRGPGRTAGLHLAGLDDPRACCVGCPCDWTWCRCGGSRTAWSSCSGARWRRYPATTSSWRGWRRRTRRRRSSVGHGPLVVRRRDAPRPARPRPVRQRPARTVARRRQPGGEQQAVVRRHAGPVPQPPPARYRD